MEKFIINYGTMVEDVEVEDLQEAKEIAINGMGYTGQAVVIEDEEGSEVTRSEWFGVDGSDEDNVLVQFGNTGYYQIWNDELE